MESTYEADEPEAAEQPAPVGLIVLEPVDDQEPAGVCDVDGVCI